MTRLRKVALLIVIAHWTVAMWHLYLAAKVLPPPNNKVSWLAIALLTSLHWGVAIALWKVSEKIVGPVSLIFFLAALSADLYEHFLHASLNNVFMVASSGWTAWFNGSVFMLLTLEILGCSLGVWLLRGDTRKSANPQPHANHRRQGPGSLCASRFSALTKAGL